MGTHLLFGLEDFSEWTEGKEIRESLLTSPMKNDPRFQIIENLYKIAIEITEISESEDAAYELQEIQKEMIRTFGSKIIEENLPTFYEAVLMNYFIQGIFDNSFSPGLFQLGDQRPDSLFVNYCL